MKQWCRHLRWKDLERDGKSLEAAEEAFRTAGHLYVCWQTFQPAGWDDGVVSADACGPERSCYEEHPLLTLKRSVT